MPEFEVGDDVLQDALEWVDQPPPPLGRDTHALFFTLTGTNLLPGDLSQIESSHRGLMFFRPGNPTTPIFQNQPGLTGTGSLVAQKPTPEIPFWVVVEVRFRPPRRVFGSLRFFQEAGRGLPGTHVRSVEMDKAEMIVGSRGEIRMDAPPERWILGRIQKTTVLLGPP